MATSPEDIKHLRAMVTVAKKEPVSFAVCMGAKAEGALILMHKTKKPEALAREAKAEGETSKVMYGTIEVDGTKATIKAADKVPAGIVKHLKAYFKSVDIPLKLGVLDAAGNPVEEERLQGEAEDEPAPAPAPDPLEKGWLDAWTEAEPRVIKALSGDSPEAAKIRAVRDFALGKAEARQFEAAQKSLVTLMSLIEAARHGPAQPSAEAAGPDKGDLVRRMGAFKTGLAGVDGPLAQKLTEGLLKVGEMVKAGALPGAADLLGRLEATLQKILASKAGEGQAGTATGDPRLAKIAAAEAQARKQVGAMPGGAAQDGMLRVLDAVTQALSKAEVEAALGGLKRVQDGFVQQAEIDRLAPLVARAASRGEVADVNRLTLLFNSVSDAVPAADHGKAMAALATVSEMIVAGKGQDRSTHDQDQPLDIRPYAEARISWNLAREKLKAEIKRLEAGIAAVLTREGLPSDIAVEGALMGYIAKLDARLEAKLAEIVDADDPVARTALKAEARTLIAEYRAELAGDFFKDVDDNNGFVPVAVTATAETVLADLSEVLAA